MLCSCHWIGVRSRGGSGEAPPPGTAIQMPFRFPTCPRRPFTFKTLWVARPRLVSFLLNLPDRDFPVTLSQGLESSIIIYTFVFLFQYLLVLFVRVAASWEAKAMSWSRYPTPTPTTIATNQTWRLSILPQTLRGEAIVSKECVTMTALLIIAMTMGCHLTSCAKFKVVCVVSLHDSCVWLSWSKLDPDNFFPGYLYHHIGFDICFFSFFDEWIYTGDHSLPRTMLQYKFLERLRERKNIWFRQRLTVSLISQISWDQ